MQMPTKTALILSLLLTPAVMGLTACNQDMTPMASSQPNASSQLRGEITLPYAASESGGFQTQQVVVTTEPVVTTTITTNSVVTTTVDPALRVSVDDLYTLEAVIDGEVRQVNVTDVRIDPITGQTYITYDIDTVPAFDTDAVIEFRTVDGYWLGGSLVTYQPGVLVVDVTPTTSLDVVLAREGRVPGSMKIRDLSRAELWVLGFDPDTLNGNASVRSIVKSNGQVKANKKR